MQNKYTILEDFDEYPGFLRNELLVLNSFFVKNARLTERYISGQWDGRKYFLTKKGRLSTGLVGGTLAVLKKHGETLIIDRRKNPQSLSTENWEWSGEELRDYQHEIVSEFKKRTRGYFRLATRGGKTLTVGKIIYDLKVSALYIVDGRESLYQTKDDIESCIKNIGVGLYGDGHKQTSGDVIIALVPSIEGLSASHLLFKRGILILDEAHRITAETYYKTVMKSDAYYRVGMSGTISEDTELQFKLAGALGRLFYSKKSKALGESGYIEEPTVIWRVMDAPVKIHRAVVYAHLYESGVSSCAARNNIIVDMVRENEGKQILISVEYMAHGENLLRACAARGVDAVFVYGKAKDRAALIESFKTCGVQVLIATRILNMSITLPELSIIINAAGRKSFFEVVQRAGRALGKSAKGPKDVKIYDIIDKHSICLYKHSKARARLYKEEGFAQIGLEGFKKGGKCPRK